jgi:arylsulfatase
MAIHAAMIDRTDREIGRLIDQLRAMGVYEDTLVLFLSDNGASAEIMIRGQGHDPQAAPGSDATHLCLGPGWSTHCNAPFRRHKIWVHEGGVSTPLIASWPNGIRDAGGLRHDVGHCVDVMPTLLDLAGMPPSDIPLPGDAPPLPGMTLVPTLAEDGCAGERTIYFHHSRNRALRVGNYKIVNEGTGPLGQPDDAWALYDLSRDRCERHDLSAEQPERCAQMKATWEQLEATYRAQGNL